MSIGKCAPGPVRQDLCAIMSAPSLFVPSIQALVVFQLLRFSPTPLVQSSNLFRLAMCRLISTNAQNVHCHLPIQRFLLFLRGLHTQCALDLRLGPESDTRPGHNADSEESPSLGAEAAVGAVLGGERLVSLGSRLGLFSFDCRSRVIGFGGLCHVPPERHWFGLEGWRRYGDCVLCTVIP